MMQWCCGARQACAFYGALKACANVLALQVLAGQLPLDVLPTSVKVRFNNPSIPSKVCQPINEYADSQTNHKCRLIATLPKPTTCGLSYNVKNWCTTIQTPTDMFLAAKYTPPRLIYSCTVTLSRHCLLIHRASWCKMQQHVAQMCAAQRHNARDDAPLAMVAPHTARKNCCCTLQHLSKPLPPAAAQLHACCASL